MATYTLTGKQENDKGVVFTFIEHRNLIEVIVHFLLNPFSGFVANKHYEGFYPITEHGTHMETDMCFINGEDMEYHTSKQLRNLLKVAKFKDVPSKESTVDVQS